MPSAKLVVGYPLYGWGWSGAESLDLGVPAAGPAPGTEDEDGLYGWDALRDGILTNTEVRIHESAKGAWAGFDDIVVTFDDPTIIELKADYVRRNGLGGLSGWGLGFDVTAELPNVARAALTE